MESVNSVKCFCPHCTTLWKILESYGCPDKLVNIIKQFHYEIKAQVSVGSEPSDAFLVNYGVKQGCVLPPSLFSLYLTAVLETMNEGLNRDVFIRTGTDGKLFNLAQLDIFVPSSCWNYFQFHLVVSSAGHWQIGPRWGR